MPSKFARTLILPPRPPFRPLLFVLLTFPPTRTLRSSGPKRGIAGTKGSTNGSRSGGRNTDGSGNERPLDAGPQGSSSSSSRSRNAPPAIVLRAPKVQAQKRLHGKPASSFFARAYAAGVTLAPTEETVLDEPSCPSPTAPLLASAAGVSPRTTTEQQAASVTKAAVAECTSAVVKVAVKPLPTPPAQGHEHATSAARSVNTVSLSSNVSTCASALDCCSSIASDGHHTSSTSVLDSASSSRNNEEGVVLDGAPNRSKQGSAVRSATLSRGTCKRAGYKRVGRKAAKGGDGRTTPGVPALHGELMLLDGCLHDHKVRTWVETTLVPAKKHQQRVV